MPLKFPQGITSIGLLGVFRGKEDNTLTVSATTIFSLHTTSRAELKGWEGKANSGSKGRGDGAG